MRTIQASGVSDVRGERRGCEERKRGHVHRVKRRGEEEEEGGGGWRYTHVA
jgi:hypothetical protein